MEKFSNATLFRQIALQNLQRKNLRFSETEYIFQNETSNNKYSFYENKTIGRTLYTYSVADLMVAFTTDPVQRELAFTNQLKFGDKVSSYLKLMFHMEC